MIEAILKDTAYAYPEDFRYISLRYFNVAGAHPAGGIGQKGPQITHLIPNILRAAMGSKKLTVFGKDWPTPDGTCIRDYIHVVDLCQAHLLALKAFDRGVNNEIFNLGSSKGFSVKAMIRAVEQVTGKKVPHRYGPRRPGDPARLIASSKKAREILGWRPRYGLDEIIETAWQWENR
jgi:UDP-glucose 4-epimerase